MANNYTQFSIVLPIFHSMKFEEVTEFYEANREMLDEDENCRYVESDIGPSGIWLYSNESGDIDLAIEYIQKYLTHFNIGGGVYLSWAETCSKLRTNEFSGGGALITKDEFHTVNSYDVVTRHKEITLICS